MSHIFCQQCGFKLEYPTAKPKFCSSCGASTGVVATATVRKPPTLNNNDDLEDDESDIDSFPELDGLDVEVEPFSNASTFNLGALFGQPQETKRRRSTSRNISDFIDERKSK